MKLVRMLVILVTAAAVGIAFNLSSASVDAQTGNAPQFVVANPPSPATWDAGDLVLGIFRAEDSDPVQNETLIYTISGTQPMDFTFEPPDPPAPPEPPDLSADIVWQTDLGDVGTYTFTIRATDTDGNFAEVIYTIIIQGTLTDTPTATATSTATNTATETSTATPTDTPTATSTATSTATETSTATNTPVTPTATNTSVTETATATSTATNTSVTATATPTTTQTGVPTGSATARPPAVHVSRLNATVTEGGISTIYNVRLGTAPAHNERVMIVPSFNAAQFSVSPPSRMLTRSTWSTGRNFTITALNDTVDEAAFISAITHTSTSNQPGSPYNGAPAGMITVTVNDND